MTRVRIGPAETDYSDSLDVASEWTGLIAQYVLIGVLDKDYHDLHGRLGVNVFSAISGKRRGR